MDDLLFCDFFDMPFLISYIFVVVIWIGVAVFIFTKINEIAGIIFSIGVAIAYLSAMTNEFNAGDTLHGIIALLGVILFVLVIIYGYKEFAKEEEIRNAEIPLIPGRVEGFISAHGYTSPQEFIRYSNEATEFQKARSVQYINPRYKKQVENNKQRKNNKLEPLPITEPEWIGYGDFASFKYREIVLTYFMKELPNAIKNIYMFNYENLYNCKEMASFKAFYLKDDGSVDMIYFQQACIGIIMQSIAEGLIETVGGSNNLFRSKIIPEDEGNIVFGETLELSFDD